jgi:hypothetical protein
MSQVTRDNHYVPQLYLKQWSPDGLRVWAYQTLVSHDNVPEWEYRSIKQVAFQRDLYTEIEDGKEVDKFEKWLEAKFEGPVQGSIQKVLNDKPLSPLDWERLIGFLGAQDVRTPLNYLESSERWKRTLPNLMENILKKSVHKLKQNKLSSTKPISTTSYPEFDDLFKIEIKQSESEQSHIGAEITVGRKLWLQSQRRLLTKTISVLKNHKWCIVRPAQGLQWFTSDHPVVKLNYYPGGNYDLKGGWGKKGGNIFMPISPKHLLFTQIGDDIPDYITLLPEQTIQFQVLLAERALRWIFAQEQLKIISKFRPRYVNPDIYKREIAMWDNWHKHQKQAEN